MVARIHGTLVIAPSVPRLPSAATDPGKVGQEGDADADDEAADASRAVAGAAEIPFVPAAQRARAEPVEDDSIVVVGQRRPKKRKRAPKVTKTEQGSEPVEAFDYGAVSNILDDDPEPEVEDASAAKKRKKKQGAYHCAVMDVCWRAEMVVCHSCWLPVRRLPRAPACSRPAEERQPDTDVPVDKIWLTWRSYLIYRG